METLPLKMSLPFSAVPVVLLARAKNTRDWNFIPDKRLLFTRIFPAQSARNYSLTNGFQLLATSSIQ